MSVLFATGKHHHLVKYPDLGGEKRKKFVWENMQKKIFLGRSRRI
jgi:hypothetical protein